MPRYFFDSIDGETDIDNQGVELSGAEEAVCEAVHYAGSLMNDQPKMLEQNCELIITARDENDRVVANVRVEVTRPN